MTAPLLETRDLRVDHHGRRGRTRAVDGVALRLPPGRTLGLVGESGSGKSTIAGAVLGLVRPTGGRVLFRGADITHASPRRRRELSRHLQAVFQDPYGTLNPSRTIGQTLTEPLRV
ncbi:ATP-binding cassette domain-containing protein, partial [Actinomadura fibrosa]